MPIEKGQDWGEAGQFPRDGAVVGSDHEAAALVAGAAPEGLPIHVAFRAGDIARTLGVREAFDPRSSTHRVLVDALRIELDDGEAHVGVAHAVIGRPLKDAHVVAVMNAAFIGTRNVAPRSHPGDGKADVVTFRLRPGDRVKALRRMATGSHLPHPDIRLRQRAEGEVDLARPRPVWLDGRRVGRSRTLRFRILADAMSVPV